MAHDTAPTPTRVIVGIYLTILMVLLAVAIFVLAFGLPALTMVGIGATVLVYALLIIYAAGG